jgi:hypothetical protein
VYTSYPENNGSSVAYDYFFNLFEKKNGNFSDSYKSIKDGDSSNLEAAECSYSQNDAKLAGRESFNKLSYNSIGDNVATDANQSLGKTLDIVRTSNKSLNYANCGCIVS